MRPILYSADERAFDTNGIGVLVDVLSWNVVEELNGSFELSLRYPTNGIHYKNLVRRAIILAKPNPVADPQPFRIYRRIPSSNGTVTVRARHIAYDLSGNTVDPFRAVGAAAALAALKANSTPQCLFDFWTDKAAGSEMGVQKPATIWSLLGGMKGSVLDCFGGEYEFDRFTVKLFTRRGSDQGVSIRYGKNLVSLEQDENCANCYTGIYPFWASADEASAELVVLPERTVNAQGNFGYTRILPVDFSSEWLETPTEDMLRARAERYIEENQIGVPNVSLTVQHVSLDQTAEYAGRIPLERVLLGDSVSVFFPDLEVSAAARVVATDYDGLRDAYNSTTIGSAKSSLASTIVQQQKETQEKPDVGMTQHIAARLAAAMTGAHGGAVRQLDTNGDGFPDEYYVADDPDPVKAKKVWRWNCNGFAASEEGYNGPFIMGATFEDGLLAHMVRAANLIAGTIASADGSTFFLDLDNGILKGDFSELSINGKSVSGSISELSLRTDGIAASVTLAQDTADIANAAAKEAKQEIVSQTTAYEQRADAVDISVKELRQAVGTKADQSQVNEITEHFRFAADGMTITNSATGMGINVSEQQVAFTGGNDPTTVITPNAMQTTNLQVGTRLDVGGFSLIPRSNNNLSLRWTGG